MPAISEQVATIEHDLAVANTTVDSLRSENAQLKQALAALQSEHVALQAKHSDAIALVDETRQHADTVATAALAMLKVSRRQISPAASEASKALAAMAPSLEQQTTQAVAEALEPEKTDVRPELPVIDQGQQEVAGEPLQGDSGDEIPNTDRLRLHMEESRDPLPIFLAPRNPPAQPSVLG